MNYLIIGGPKCGKSTKADLLRFELNDTGAEIRSVKHCDDLVKTLPEWSMVSEAVCDWIKEPGPWIIEGVAGVRGLRKFLERNNTLLSDLTVYWMSEAKTEQTPAQRNMQKGAQTIFDQIKPELLKRGAKIIYEI